MAAWSQILQNVGNSTVFYISFDTHDSPGSVFVWKSKFTIEDGNVGKILVKCPCVGLPRPATTYQFSNYLLINLLKYFFLILSSRFLPCSTILPIVLVPISSIWTGKATLLAQMLPSPLCDT